MSTTVPRVLLLEDDAADALLIAESLSRSLPAARITRAATRQEYLALLDGEPVDVVLSDGSVPGCEGIEAFYLARRHDQQVTFLFISGVDREPDLRALRALGISEFLSKDDLEEVGSAVGRALTGRDTWVDQARLSAGLELVLAASHELALAADLATVMSLAQGTARRLTGAGGTTFAVREGDECHYLDEEHVDPDFSGTRWTGLRFPLGECLSGWTMQHRQPAVVDDVGADPRVSPAFRGAALTSAVVVPIRSAQPLAAIGAYWAQCHESDATEVVLLLALADSTAVALESLRLRRDLEVLAAARAADLAALTYAISHDLRAPIRHLEGFTRILLQDLADPAADTRRGAQRIQDAAGHLREMVNGMLTLSRIGQSEVHPGSVDLAQLGREVAQELANAPTPDGGQPRAGVVEFVAPQNVPVTGDRRLLLTVLQNLLGNAWKFTSRTPNPQVELGVAAGEPDSGAGSVYFVRDNGAGFEPAAADRLFVVFQRLHSGEDFPGIGIGLAVVKRIVDKHGGTVRATGSPGSGATIFFTLPDRGVRPG